MFKEGDRVKVISLDKGVSGEYLNRHGVISKIKPKEYYKYYIQFEDVVLAEHSKYQWWRDENLVLSENEQDKPNEIESEKILCLRCGTPLKYLKEYRFDSQDNNRGLLAILVDYEERLIFDVFVCPKCNHTEFFYTGVVKGTDRMTEW